MNLSVSCCSDRASWEAFLAKESAPTFLQSWEWKVFHEAQGYRVFPLIVTEEQETKAIALVIKIPAKRGAYLLCAHGPVITKETSADNVLKALTTYLENLGKQESCVFIRLCPLLKDGPDSAKQFQRLGYRPAPIHQAPELAWILSLAPSEAELLKNMRKATRHSINHREKDGIEVSSSDKAEDLERFWKVYKETADRQNFSPFSKSYLQTEFETFQKEGKVRLFFGSFQGKTISTALVLFSPQSAFYHHGASSHQHSKVNASCALQWEAICEAKRRGCNSYNFWGIAPPDQPKHPWTGLSLFKTGFGGEAAAYLHAQDKPLSKKYWLNYAIEKIRAWRRGFSYPDPMKTK